MPVVLVLVMVLTLNPVTPYLLLLLVLMLLLVLRPLWRGRGRNRHATPTPTPAPKAPHRLAQRHNLRVLPPHLPLGRPVQRRGVAPQRLVLGAQPDALCPDQRRLPLQRPDAPLGLLQP